MATQKWIREEIDPTIKAFLDGDLRSYEKFCSSYGRGLSWDSLFSLSKLNHIKESFLKRWLIGGQKKARTRK